MLGLEKWGNGNLPHLIAENRRWPYDLQNAIEAKEGLEIQPEGTILGSITLQHFLGLYPKLAGMTATAKTSSADLSGGS